MVKQRNNRFFSNISEGFRDSLTAYQKLSKSFITNNPVNDDLEQEAKRKAEIANLPNEEDRKVAMLQYRQDQLIRSQSSILNQSNRNRVYGYESNRIHQYYDYEAMEFYPIISAALDLYAEEATTIGQNGKMLSIYSKDKRIKSELENLFYNILDINVTLPYWTRNVVKYGDNFVYLVTDSKFGIIDARQLTNIEVERVEEEVDDRYKIVFKYKNSQGYSSTNNVSRNGGEKEFLNWQVAHFRLLGDDRRMPYGMSVLDKIRRTFRMLTMSEDAMLTYRALRAAERRVFKVNVGNIPPEDIPQYIQQIASHQKKSGLVDPVTGDFNWQFNPGTNDEDYYIPTTSDNIGTVIDTLPGAANLNDIADITYLRDNLFTGLGIPKSFLAFSDDDGGKGDGKNLSLLDIRFARKVNRIQQALIAELNKIAIIHLTLLGGDFKNSVEDFALTLANPSIQSEILRLEALEKKITVYQSSIQLDEQGIRPMSITKAKKEILGMSNEEIIDDLREQFLENKIGAEIKNAPQLIKNSHIYTRLINYMNAGVKDPTTNEQGEDNFDGGFGGDLGGGFGGDLGGEFGDDLGGGFGDDLGNSDTNQGQTPLTESQLTQKKAQFYKDMNESLEKNEKSFEILISKMKPKVEKINPMNTIEQESSTLNLEIENIMTNIEHLQANNKKKNLNS